MTETPEFMSPSAAIEAHETAQLGNKAAERLRTLEIEADPNAPRMFLCPQHPTGKFLIHAGAVRRASNAAGFLGLEPLMARDGDIWVRFSAGAYALMRDDENYDEILAWLEAHSGDPEVHVAFHELRSTSPRNCQVPIGLVQESGPGVGDWAELKAGQMPTSRRPATISPELDVDGYFLRGGPKRFMTSGEGARMEETARATSNAASARAAGNRQN